MLCVVTGGAGFIGSHTVDALVRCGRKVRVLDSLATGDLGNLEDVKGQIELVEADVRDRHAVSRAFRDAEVVFHLAAVTSIPRSVEDPALFHDVNTMGTLNVLLAAREQNVRRVIYASTSSVYGDSRQVRKRENMPPSPASPYGATKLAGEMYCRTFTTTYGLETISLRYMTVFGPRQKASSGYGSAIPTFVAQMLRGETPAIFGDGTQSRDFIHVSNAVHANLLAMDATHGIGQAFNVGAGCRYTVLEILDKLNLIMGTHVKPAFAPRRAGDIRHMIADLTAVHNRLGYQPVMSLEEGLADTVSWFRRQLPARERVGPS